MGLTQNLGRISAGLTADASLNIGVGVTPSGTFRFEVGTTSKFTGVATFGSTLSNGTYTYTLPSATGTLALTSALSGYLPLTGGTLTGALSGTSATFSSSVSAVSGVIESGGFNIKGTGATAYPSMLRLSNAANASFYWDIWRDNTTGKLNFGGASGVPIATFLSIDGSTGAATFSSSGVIGGSTYAPNQSMGGPASSGTTQNGSFRIRVADNAVLDFGMYASGGGAWLQTTNQTLLSAYYNLILQPNGGNTLIGTSTDAGYKLDVNGTGRFTSTLLASGAITGQSNANTFGTASATGRAVIIQAGSTNQAIMFKNAAGGDGTLFINGTSTSVDYNFNTYSVGDALVIKNSGSVGIGTDSPDVTGFGWKTLTIKGGTGSGNAGVIELQNTVSVSNDQNLGIIAFLDGTSRNAQISVRRESSTSTAHMDFWTNAGAGLVERMRITSGGAVQISAPSAGQALTVTGRSNAWTTDIIGSSTTGQSYGLLVEAGTNSTDYSIYAQNQSGSIALFRVRGDGLIYTGTASLSPYNYGVSGGVALYVGSSGQLGYNSSVRESKSNITVIKNINWLNNLQPVTFNKKKKDDEGNYTEEIELELQYGLIAEDVEQVNPDFVFYNNEGKLAGVHYDRLITPILKLVQEQQQQIKELQSQITELKNITN